MRLPPPRIAVLAAALSAFTLALGCGGESTGTESADAATPEELAAGIAANDDLLRREIVEWIAAAGDPPALPPPEEVITSARILQEQVRFLVKRDSPTKATIAALPPDLGRRIAALVAASRQLVKLSAGARGRKLKVGEPALLSELVSHYRKAEGRYGVDADYLAAINLVETKFGRVKSRSTAGAQGPMQFIPTTWKIYGRGGDINDPHDAIQAAARLLRANGAPRSYARALHAYNPSKLYVRAVSIYAKLIARDPYAIHFLYCWGP
jgi:membrane-bound lytic murein transglycosylase B